MQNTRENKMGTMPINKLLLTISLPMVASMLVQALYNIVDSFFVSQFVGEKAFTAVSLAFPLQNLMIAFATGTGVGINALLSKSLGEKNFDRANKAANHGIFLSTAHSIIFVLIGIFVVPAFFKAQNSDPDVIRYGIEYASVCLILSLGLFTQITTERLLLATGKSMLSMATQLTGALINLILDPIFIIVFKMGALGAAAATVAGQIIAALLGIYFNLTHNPDIHVSFRKFRLDGATIKRIYAVGLPSTIMASVTSVMTFGINKILNAFPDILNQTQSVFGAYYKLQSFIFMPVFGLNNGMVPIIAYNYGAKRPDRMKKTIRLAIMYAMIIMLIGFLAFTLLPHLLLSLFQTDLTLGVPAFRAISLSFLFAGFCIITGSVLQAVGSGVLSMFVSIVRQLVVLLPAAYLLSLTGNVNMVWFSFPIAEIASLIMSALFLRHVFKTIINPLYKQ